MWTSKPLIVIKKLSEDRYTWQLYLSNNRKRPTCVSPTVYSECFKARARAKEFAAKLRGPLKIQDNTDKSTDVLIIDETRPLKLTEDELNIIREIDG